MICPLCGYDPSPYSLIYHLSGQHAPSCRTRRSHIIPDCYRCWCGEHFVTAWNLAAHWMSQRSLEDHMLERLS